MKSDPRFRRRRGLHNVSRPPGKGHEQRHLPGGQPPRRFQMRIRLSCSAVQLRSVLQFERRVAGFARAAHTANMRLQHPRIVAFGGSPARWLVADVKAAASDLKFAPAEWPRPAGLRPAESRSPTRWTLSRSYAPPRGKTSTEPCIVGSRPTEINLITPGCSATKRTVFISPRLSDRRSR